MKISASTKAITAGTASALGLILAIYIGSNGLKHFDHALYWYAIGSIAGAFAIGYRFTLWASRPPSRLYFKRGLQLLLRSGPKYEARRKKTLPETELAKATAINFAGQNFIRKRNYYRWIMHLCLSGGCALAFAITFPLVFGWIHFETPLEDAEVYHVMVFGKHVDTFNVHSLKGSLLFNSLNIAGILALIGVVMASVRRMTNAGEKAVQTFYEDILPLILIFCVAITGLALTVSYKYLAGQGYEALVWVHMITVIALILYIPFGKLFHLFQRTASLCVSMYKKAGDNEEQATCLITGEKFASKRHVEDLKIVLDELGFDYRFKDEDGNEVHYQDISPSGRRRLLAVNQGKPLGR